MNRPLPYPNPGPSSGPPGAPSRPVCLFLDLSRGRWRVGPPHTPREFTVGRRSLGVQMLHTLASRPGDWFEWSDFTTGGRSAASNLKGRALELLRHHCPPLADELSDGIEDHRGRVRYCPWPGAGLRIVTVNGCEQPPVPRPWR